VQFQFNSDNQIDGNDAVAVRVEEITRSRLSHIVDRLTRIEVHVSDVTGARGADSKRCVVEARPAGMSPISATDQAGNIDAAVTAAADKLLAAYERQVGKRTDRKGH
jgi:ribosome-associated translation inhibitor RaiA